MKKLILSFLLINSLLSFSQDSKIDVALLETKVFTLINNYRDSLSIPKLKKDFYLKKAAIHHSKYITEHQTLTHEQTNVKSKNPKNRVLFYLGNDFILVGENLLFTSIKDKTYTEADLDILADKMFTLWKKSPNHLKIMTSEKYSFTGFGFQIDWGNKKLYVVQVFGAK